MIIERKTIIWIVRFSPIITNIAAVIGLTSTFFYPKLINHISPFFSGALFTCFGWWLLSKYFQFCFFHQLLIYNLALISCLVYLQINFRPFENIVYIRIILFSTIITLFLYYIITSLIFKNRKNEP